MTRNRCISTVGSRWSAGSSTTTPCPCGPGSPPRSFSSTRNPSAASFASPSTTSPTTRPPSPSSWETPPSPLPEPVADLMRAYIQSRQHLPYASSRSSQWLFPGRQPGQPMTPVSLQVHLREIGVPPQRGRTSAIRQLVLQAPPPSSRRHSAITTRPPPAWSPRPAEPGADTPPATTEECVVPDGATCLSALLDMVRIAASRGGTLTTTFDELTAWAGTGNVTRADSAVVSSWQIPEEQKALLVDVGIPIVDQLIEYISFQVETAPVLQTSDGRSLYRLSQNRHGDLVPGPGMV